MVLEETIFKFTYDSPLKSDLDTTYPNAPSLFNILIQQASSSRTLQEIPRNRCSSSTSVAGSKRPARRKKWSRLKGKENAIPGTEIPSTGICDQVGNKRKWRLQDEVDDLCETGPGDKWLKGAECYNDEKMIDVEEASHKWPYADQ